jgi:PAS domain-containing protein
MKSNPARELNVALAVLAAVLVSTALVAIHVLERMAPAVAVVIDDNAASLQATGDMLAALAEQRLPEPAAAAARQRFSLALAAATLNQTEPAEAKPLVELQELSAAALAGEPRALERALAAIEALERANRSAMQVVGADAARLGRAGAWTLAFLGLLGFGVGSLVRRRLQRRVTAPLLELERVLLSADAGDRLQRCASTGYFSSQQRALRALNRLLDAINSHAASAATGASSAEVVPWVLDASREALVVLDTGGVIVSASRAALETLSGEHDERLVERLRRTALGSTDERVTLLRRSERHSLLAIAAPRGAAEPSQRREDG